MKLGIKVGPQKQSINDLERTKAPFAEVWFQIDKKDAYDDIFSYLTKQNIDTGLHFWGLTHDGFLPSIAYNDQEFLQESVDLIRQTIDIAATNNFSYVTMHPGNRAKIRADFQTHVFTIASDPVETKTVEHQFLENIHDLSLYGRKKNVILIVETVPLNVVKPWDGNRKTQTYPMYELPLETFQKGALQGIAIANDFGHTAGNYISDSSEDIFTLLKKQTVALVPYTKLLHITFLVPPYNGTDFHSQLDDPILKTNDAVPNKHQMIELLQLFENRNDMWALAEPNGQHPKNYFLAQKLLADAGL
jgi:hypothetical protein